MSRFYQDGVFLGMHLERQGELSGPKSVQGINRVRFAPAIVNGVSGERSLSSVTSFLIDKAHPDGDYLPDGEARDLALELVNSGVVAYFREAGGYRESEIVVPQSEEARND